MIKSDIDNTNTEAIMNKLISNNIKKINTIFKMSQKNTFFIEHKINDEVYLYIGDSMNLSKERKFTMIYFDPPFNSNRDYNLNCNNNLGFSDKWNDEDYEEFIRKQIELLYNLLEDNGTLFFHISSTCMFIPEKILRHKFKFVEPIFWKKCRSKNNVKTKLGSVVDIIWKCNKIKKAKFNIVYQKKDATYLKNSFKNKDTRGNYALGHLVTEKTKKGYMYEITINNRIFNPTSGWRIKKEKLKELIDDDRIHVPRQKKSNLYKKIYLHEHPGKPCTDLWDDIHSISQGSEGRKYPTAKPVKLLERLIEISTDEGDYVLDPMCGSGTTAEAAYKLNRKSIINDINNDVVDIVKSRFQ